MHTDATVAGRLSSGIRGLDEVMAGGLIANQSYLVRGAPGSGKTILGMHFLAAGLKRGETCLFITLGEPESQIRRNAQALGFNFDAIHFIDLSPESEYFAKAQSIDIFTIGEVEREPVTRQIVEQIQALRPQRVFLDALTQFRYLAPDAYQFRRLALSFLRYLVQAGATVLFSSEGTPAGNEYVSVDDDLQFMSDGIIHLQFTEIGRKLFLSKYRGSDFIMGRHVYRIGAEGIVVAPHRIPSVPTIPVEAGQLTTGNTVLDEMLHGGIERGSATLITGPTGSGKTTLALQLVREAARRQEKGLIYLFDEHETVFLRHCESIGVPITAFMQQGLLKVVPVSALRYTPEEFSFMVLEDTRHMNASLVLIDSLSGYRLCLKGDDLTSHMHELIMSLQKMGNSVLLVNEVEHITGSFVPTEAGISYLADNIIYLRYFEVDAVLRKAIGILKKRMSKADPSLREFEIGENGVSVGQPLSRLHSILSGDPRDDGCLVKGGDHARQLLYPER